MPSNRHTHNVVAEAQGTGKTDMYRLDPPHVPDTFLPVWPFRVLVGVLVILASLTVGTVAFIFACLAVMILGG
jgi:hypothetical protein